MREKYKNLTPWIKIPLLVLCMILLLLLVVWMVLAIYIHNNKKGLLKKITYQINERINGNVSIQDMNLSFFRGFPGVSFSLNEVVLRDSLWNTHHHDLLNAQSVYVSFNALSLLSKSPEIKDVHITDAVVYLYIDSSGYSNTSIFQKKQKDAKKKNGKKPEINHVTFTDVTVTLDNDTKRKMFQLAISRLVAGATYNDTGWVAHTQEDIVFKDFTFNEEKGSFLKNKRLRSNLTVHFNDASKTLFIPQQSIRLDEDELKFWAKFMFINSPPQFSLKFIARQIQYKNAVALTSPNIQEKIKVMDLKNPLDLYTFIDGRIKFRDTPLVKVNWVVKNNVFITPGGEITDCSFTGYFINSAIPGKGMNDKNSLISVPVFTGNYAGVPFRADSVSIENLIQPVLTGNLKSAFKVDKLNESIGSDAISFNKGNANMELTFKVGLSKNDPTPPFLKGYVGIRNLDFSYLPRDIHFSNSDVTLFFTGEDLLVRKTKLQSKNSVLYVDGIVRNFLNLYYTAPEKIILNWNIHSPLINLNEFQSLLSARKKTKAPKKFNQNTSAGKVTAQLDEVLDKSNVNMALSLNKVIYKKFIATDITATMQMNENNIFVKDAVINNSDGQLRLNADVYQKGKVNDIAIKAAIKNVNVSKFFEGFSNFGQQTIKAENIKGKFTANVDAKTQITDGGEVVSNSMSGGLNFALADGELNDFEPFLKIGKIIFRNRNLGHVTFRDIHGKFDLLGDKIKIYPMHIESSAFTMGVEGMYGFNAGTNIFIDLPLRNPQKDADIQNDSLRAIRSMKGIVLRLQAVDGDDGKVHIKLRSSARKRAESLREEETTNP